MQLPQISIPLTLPFEVPTMLHPVIIHFALVLPVIVLLIELANLGFKRRALSLTSLGLLLLSLIFFVAAYYTGKADGGEAFDLLGTGAREALGAHKMLGTYLVYALLIPIAFKLAAMLLAQKWARGALIVTLIMLISFMVKQGYDGGELVYRYGVNVSAVTEAEEAASDLRDDLADMNETVAEQAAEIETLKVQIAAMQQQAGESFGQKVDKAVTDAVSKVKKIFSEDNATKAAPQEEKAPSSEANGTI
ncbi:hypothetical protein LOH54_04000 [Sulfurimonas sp. HSL-3221]|uniref:DUF2231 domain-containing protein n=1 Tax=Sulfurimonadaceae TaxID=2771471 RepID=UPI001E3C88D4|nr:DUF2231 domain-containing protein [Sulfurimonas sp. HSL-3221]UFS63296.1 hypothetical protein LOH54_04000 [Sulfurimonas sp. HSL-3221]